MKKSLLLIAFFMMLSCAAFARPKNHVAINATPMFGTDNYAPAYTFEITAEYVRDFGRLFHAGVGLGLGTANATYAFDGITVGEDPLRDDVVYAPAYLFGKIDFNRKRHHPFAKIKVGTRLGASIDSRLDGEAVNPYVFNIAPAIGYDFGIGKGSKRKLGVALVADITDGRYQYFSTWKKDYSDILTGTEIGLQAGVSVTFEF